MTDINASLQKVLEELDRVMEPLDDFSVHDVLMKLPREQSAPESTPLSETIMENAAFAFCPEYHWKSNGWKSYYGPLFVTVDGEGKPNYFPDIARFDIHAFEYWQKRSGDAKHPVLRIRYADLCWEFQKKIIGTKPNIEMARTVIDATIEAINRRLVKQDTNGRKKLARALSIAIKIGDDKRVEDVRDAIVAYEDITARDEYAGMWGYSFDLIIENRNVPKTPELEAKIIGDMERRLTNLVVIREGKPIDPWNAQSAAIRLAKYYRRDNRPADVRRVLLVYGTAFEQAAETATGMIASAWLRTVHRHYHEFGLKDEADQLLLKVRDYARKSHGEMATYTDSFEVTKEEMDGYLQELVHGELSESLDRIAIRFTPRRENIVELIKEIHKKSPLHSLMALTLVDGDGRPIANIGSIENDMESRVVYQIAQEIRFSGMFLRVALDYARQTYSPSPNILIDHLRQSPLFSESQLRFLLAGINAYMHGDHLSAAHLFVPQIEAAVRRLAELSGANLWRPHRSGGMMIKNLDDLLREEVVLKCLKDDITLYLRVILTDQRGGNLRNDICHGLLPIESFGRGMTDRLLHVLLILGGVRRGPKNSQPGKPNHE